MMHIKLWVLLLSMSLLTACSKEEAGTEAPGEPTKEICFSLNAGDAIGLSPARAAASIDGMSWKLLCFSDEYQYLFEATGTVSADEVKVQVPKGQAFRFLMLFAADASTLPSLEAGSSYWDLPAYAPQLPLSDPMSLLVGKGEEDGTIRVSASATKVAVALSPRAAKVTLQADASVADGISVEGITFSNAAKSVPYGHINPQQYGDYNLPATERTTYEAAFGTDNACYVLPDLFNATIGASAVLRVGGQDVPVTVPEGLALNANAGKNYYIELTDNGGQLAACWATRAVQKTLKMATQNLWGKPAATVLDLFNQIDVDVLCAQECSGFTDAEIQAAGLYVHSHTNNGQGRCSIISRYPFEGTTPNGYGVYIDLGDGIETLVMNCHGAYKPYGPYQLNGIAYGGYEPTDDVDAVIEINKETRQDMVDKLLADVASATTPFISISGDFNEPSWLDWTAETVAAGMEPYVVQWPTTHSLYEGGIQGDAYRTIHPDPVAYPGYTWTPKPSAQDTEDRIDLTLYNVTDGVTVESCQVVGESDENADLVLPSWVFDHRGVRTVFSFQR